METYNYLGNAHKNSEELLDMLNIMEQILDNSSVLCSSEKSGNYAYKSKYEAMHHKFVRFGNKYFLPTLSIDIDNTPFTEKDLLTICYKYKIPTPTIIVKTTKGYHMHWVLDTVINTSNKKVVYLYELVISALSIIFKADIHAIAKKGRVWRNPLFNELVFFKNERVSLNDFKKLVKRTTVKSIKRKSEGVFKKTVKDDMFYKVKKGERNVTMFSYIRKLAYPNHGMRVDALYNFLFKKAKQANSKMADPLPLQELEDIVNSVVKFMETSYIPSTTNPDKIEYNRKLAQRKKDKTEEKIIKFFQNNFLLTLRDIRQVSIRNLAALIGVSKSTIHRYKNKLPEIIKKSMVIIKSFVHSFSIETNNAFSILLQKYFNDISFPFESTYKLKSEVP